MSATSFLLLILLPATALIGLYVVWPLLRHSSGRQVPTNESAEQNRAIIRERRAQLEAELAELPPDSPEREALIQEFSAAALADLQPGSTAASHESEPEASANQSLAHDRNAEANAAVPQTSATGTAPAQTACNAAPGHDEAVAGTNTDIGATRRRADTAQPDDGGERSSRPHLLSAVIFLVALVALPIALYRTTGMPEAVQPDFAQQAKGQPDVESLLATLEERLAADPSLVEGWLMLGRTRLSLGQRDKAVAALEKALEVDSPEPRVAAQILVDLADALGQQAGTRLEGRPWQLIQDALTRFPNHPKAMALAGAYQMSQNHPKEALGYWEPLLGMLEPGTQPYQQIARHVAQVRSQAGMPPLETTDGGSASPGAPAGQASTPPPARQPGQPSSAAMPGATDPSGVTASAKRPARPTTNDPVLKGTVQLTETLLVGTRPENTVFLAVRGVDQAGEPVGPPLAVQRIRVADLPHRFSFDDSDAMGPMGRLSSRQRVVVIARVSRSGQPTPQAGDLEGRSAVVDNDASDVLVEIDTRR